MDSYLLDSDSPAHVLFQIITSIYIVFFGEKNIMYKYFLSQVNKGAI